MDMKKKKRHEVGEVVYKCMSENIAVCRVLIKYNTTLGYKYSEYLNGLRLN